MMVPCTQDESDSDDDEYFSDEDSGPQHKRRKTVISFKLELCTSYFCIFMQGSFEERKRKQLWKKRKYVCIQSQ